MGLYRPLVAKSHLDGAKALGLNDRKQVHIIKYWPVCDRFNRRSFRAVQMGLFN